MASGSAGEGSSDARHLTFATLEQLWDGGTPMVLPIQGSPECRLHLDPTDRTITLVVPYESPEPDVVRLENVEFRGVVSDGRDFGELSVDVQGSVHGAYALLASVADGIQLAKLPVAAAVAAGVSRYRHVLAGREALTTEKEVGLLGELLFLEFLLESVGVPYALQAWNGPLSEEHDFALEKFHVEVKTTNSERRRHVIHGLEQLVPLSGVPLYLLSIQLTRADPSVGRTLPGLVADLRIAVGGYRDRFDRLIDEFGWDDADAQLYQSHWATRSKPRAYRVHDLFPAMTPDRVAPVVSSFPLVSDVSYKVDLTDFEFEGLPDPVEGFVEEKEN